MGAITEPVMEQEWQKYKPKIDNNSIIIEILINGVLFKLILMNTDCVIGYLQRSPAGSRAESED